MLEKILYFIAIICIIPFFIAGIVSGIVFFFLFALIFAIIKIIANNMPNKKEGKIFANGQIVTVEYEVIEEDEKK